MVKGNRGDILTGDVIFIILNVIFVAILIFFVVTKTNDAAIIEEKYAKQIALIIDSARPGMRINLDMEDAIKKAIDENQNIGAGIMDLVKIDNERNLVTVKLRDEGGYSYSFFNEVNASTYLDIEPNEQEYVITIKEIK